jgi:hypothetical protein
MLAIGLVCAGLALGPGGSRAENRAAASSCPSGVDRGAIASVAGLRHMNRYLARLGVRPTGSPAQERYISFIRHRMRAIPGIHMSRLGFSIDRFVERSASLRLRIGHTTTRLPVASAVPYSKPTGGDGVTGPLTIVPDDQAITAENSAGKIVVRPAPAGSIPYAVFFPGPIAYWMYDPGHTIDPTASYEGDFINYDARLADLHDAEAAGARGILFTKDLPTRQLRDHYEPYEGQRFGVPGLWLGADEASRIDDAISAGGPPPRATITVRAHYQRTDTPSILATLPGRSDRRLVVDSHTDGTNAVEDNGPIAMIAIARYLSKLPIACRPRTVEFSFSTAHFYQRVASPTVRNGGAEQLAERLDRSYDKGKVSAVLVLEHLGALEYKPQPRQGGVGEVLRKTGQPELDFMAVTPSEPLLNTVKDLVQTYDLRRTSLLQGADAPGDHVPPHCSFGGEGTPFNKHLLPTIGVIAAPQTLYDPAFGMAGIDFELMHRETLAFTDLLQRMAGMSQADIAGQVTQFRAMRAAGAPTCPAYP